MEIITKCVVGVSPGLALLLALGCGTSPGFHANEKSSGVTEAVSAGAAGAVQAIQKQITIASAPFAACTLASSRVGNTVTIPVYADDIGLVHLWASPSSASDDYQLVCDEAGTTANYSFDLASPATFRPATARAKPARKTLPGLADAATVSQADVINAGYPPRPDPTLAPVAYKEWIKLASSPVTLVPSHPVERSDIHFDQVGSADHPFWDGLVVGQAAAGMHYVEAIGTMTAPEFSPTGSQSLAAFWPGLGGWTVNGSGVGESIIQSGLVYESIGNASAYGNWWQYFPNNPSFPSGIVPNPDDTITYYAWECDSSTAIVVGGGYGCFFWYDSTQGLAQGSFKTPAPGGSNWFGGTTFEAIMERPEVSPQLPLSTFNQSYMTLTGNDSNLVQHSFEAPYGVVTLVNSSFQPLATSFLNTGTQAGFTFVMSQ